MANPPPTAYVWYNPVTHGFETGSNPPQYVPGLPTRPNAPTGGTPIHPVTGEPTGGVIMPAESASQVEGQVRNVPPFVQVIGSQGNVSVQPREEWEGDVTPKGYVSMAAAKPEAREWIKANEPWRIVTIKQGNLSTSYISTSGRGDEPVAAASMGQSTVTDKIYEVDGRIRMRSELTPEQLREADIQEISGWKIYENLSPIEKVTVPLAVATITPNAFKLWGGILTKSDKEYTEAIYRQLAETEYAKRLPTEQAKFSEMIRGTQDFFTSAPLGMLSVGILSGTAAGSIAGKVLPAAAKWAPTAKLLDTVLSNPRVATAVGTAAIGGMEGIQAIQMKEAGKSSGEVAAKTLMDVANIAIATKMFSLTFPKETIVPVTRTHITSVSESKMLPGTEQGNYMGKAVTWKGDIERGVKIGGKVFGIEKGTVDVTTFYHGKTAPATKTDVENWISSFAARHGLNVGMSQKAELAGEQFAIGKESSVSRARITFPRGGNRFDVTELTGVKSGSTFASGGTPHVTRTLVSGSSEGTKFYGSVKSILSSGEESLTEGARKYTSYGMFFSGGKNNIIRVKEFSTILPSVPIKSVKPPDILPSILGSIGVAGGGQTIVTMINPLKGTEIGVGERMGHGTGRGFRIPSLLGERTGEKGMVKFRDMMDVRNVSGQGSKKDVGKDEPPPPIPVPPIPKTTTSLSSTEGIVTTLINIPEPSALITTHDFPVNIFPGKSRMPAFRLTPPGYDVPLKKRKRKKSVMRSYTQLWPVATTREVQSAMFGKKGRRKKSIMEGNIKERI